MERRKILSVLLVTVSMSLIGVSIINVALPSIQVSLGADESDLQWILSGYALTYGIMLVAAGRAGDVLGRGFLYVLGVALFCVSSIVAGLANDVSLLLFMRFVQGLGSGILSPQIVGMIQQYFQGAARGRAFGTYGTIVGLSMGLGPLIGGAIIALAGEVEGWRWTFFVNVPVSIVAIALALKWFPRPLLLKREISASPSTGSLGPRRLDLDPVGVVLLGAALLAILLPFIKTPESGWGWLLIPGGFGLIALWLGWEMRYRDSGRSPIVDVAIFKTRGFGNGVILATFYFFGVTGVWVLVALYMQQELGYSAFDAGIVGLPCAICAGLTARWTGRNVTRYGRRIVIAGVGIAIAGLALSILVIVLQAQGEASIWWLLPTLALLGVAQGSVISPNQTITLTDVPLSYAGSTGGILQTGQRIGSAIGVGVITAVAFGVRSHFGWTSAVVVSFALIIGVLFVCLAVSIADLRQRKPVHEQPPRPATT